MKREQFLKVVGDPRENFAEATGCFDRANAAWLNAGGYLGPGGMLLPSIAKTAALKEAAAVYASHRQDGHAFLDLAMKQRAAHDDTRSHVDPVQLARWGFPGLAESTRALKEELDRWFLDTAEKLPAAPGDDAIPDAPPGESGEVVTPDPGPGDVADEPPEWMGPEPQADPGPETPVYTLKGGETVRGGKLYGWTGRACKACRGIGELPDRDDRALCPGCSGTGEEWGLMPVQPDNLPPDTESD